MDIEREVQIIAYEIQTGKEEFVKGTKRILALFNVVGQSEQLPCEHERTRTGHHHDQPSYCLDCGEEL